VGKKSWLTVFSAAFLAFPLFAYTPGDLVLYPEAQVGFEIPMIRQNADYPVGKEDGAYVSMGLCWGLRLSAYYRLTNIFSAGFGLGFEGVHNQYDFTYYNPTNEADSYTERYTSDMYYFIIPAGVRAHIRALNLGAGLAAYIPLAANFSGDIKQNNIHSAFRDAGFTVNPFAGGYFDIGYDWAEKDGNSRGFTMNLRVEASFSDKIVDGDGDYKTFRHLAISLSAAYSFRAFKIR
jgi:hypothetical protein